MSGQVHDLTPRDENLPGLEAADGAGSGAAEVVAVLVSRGLTLGTCESLTGGGIAQAITSVPGASAAFRGGLVTYASDLKASLAGVDAAHIERAGVINEFTASAMARGARRVLRVDMAASCTGVAGPDPQDGAAPGTVWIAVAGPADGQVATRLLDLDGERAQVRERTIEAVFALIATVLANQGAIQHHG